MNKNIDILIVIPNLNLGGTENQLLKIFKNLPSNKYKIEILTILERGFLSSSFEKININVSCLNNYNWSKKNKFIKLILLPYLSIKYFFFLKKYKPKILHFYLPFAYWFGGLLSYFFSDTIKIMSRRSTNKYQNKYFFAKKIEKILHSKMNLITANSLFVKNELIKETEFKKKILLIYNGVDIQNSYKIYNNTNNVYKESSDEFIISNIANFIPYKGHLILLEAFVSSLKSTNKKIKLLLVGEDRNNYKKTIINKVEELGIKHNVFFLDNKVNINKVLLNSDLLISSSLEESLSNSILEAMSLGVPTIVTNVGGSSELISHECEGYLVYPNSSNSISEHINKALNNKKTLKQMSIKSRSKVENFFNITNKAKEHLEMYDNLMRE